MNIKLKVPTIFEGEVINLRESKNISAITKYLKKSFTLETLPIAVETAKSLLANSENVEVDFDPEEIKAKINFVSNEFFSVFTNKKEIEQILITGLVIKKFKLDKERLLVDDGFVAHKVLGLFIEKETGSSKIEIEEEVDINETITSPFEKASVLEESLEDNTDSAELINKIDDGVFEEINSLPTSSEKSNKNNRRSKMKINKVN